MGFWGGRADVWSCFAWEFTRRWAGRICLWSRADPKQREYVCILESSEVIVISDYVPSCSVSYAKMRIPKPCIQLDATKCSPGQVCAPSPPHLCCALYLPSESTSVLRMLVTTKETFPPCQHTRTGPVSPRRVAANMFQLIGIAIMFTTQPDIKLSGPAHRLTSSPHQSIHFHHQGSTLTSISCHPVILLTSPI